MKKSILKLCLILTASITVFACTISTPSQISQPNAFETPQPDTAAASNTKQKSKRMFVYNKKLYIDTGEISAEARCGVMDGQIKNTVSASRVPAKELQSNFGKGYGFQLGRRSNRLEVCIDDTWHIFACNENDLDGISMNVKRHTAKSAVLVIENSSNKSVTWGDAFLLEKKDYKTGEWRTVPYKHTDFAFHAIAYISKTNSSNKWKADWHYIYGTLKPGTYRIVKEFGTSGGEKQAEYHTLSAKFRIEP